MCVSGTSATEHLGCLWCILSIGTARACQGCSSASASLCHTGSAKILTVINKHHSQGLYTHIHTMHTHIYTIIQFHTNTPCTHTMHTHTHHAHAHTLTHTPHTMHTHTHHAHTQNTLTHTTMHTHSHTLTHSHTHTVCLAV